MEIVNLGGVVDSYRQGFYPGQSENLSIKETSLINMGYSEFWRFEL